jgi:phosphate starvation-inducible membrane PsiE
MINLTHYYVKCRRSTHIVVYKSRSYWHALNYWLKPKYLLSSYYIIDCCIVYFILYRLVALIPHIVFAGYHEASIC